MPRTRSLAWSELKIGIVAVAAIVLAVMIIVAVGGVGGSLLASRYELSTKFPDVKGLKSGAVVRVAGVEVGKVTEIDFSGAEVQVRLEVLEEMQQRITTESRASIGSLSLLGEPVIDVSPASTGTPLKDGDFIAAERAPGQLADVAEGATQTLEQVTGLLREIRAGKGNVGKLFTDEQLYREINAFIAAAEGVAGGLNRGQGTLGLLLKDPVAYRRMNAALGDLQELTRRVNAGEGSLGRLVNDDALAKSLTSTTGSFERISSRLEKGEGTAGKLLTDKELYDRFNSLANRVDSLVAGVNKGEGTAGSLLRDKQLYENMNAAASELRALVSDIRKDPRKYLNVRVSIF
jgi:phospholipid/cholesterol/gamma-HCH transport system substrate-binding protein